MEFSKVEIELLLEGLNAIKNGYETRQCHNVTTRIDNIIERLKKAKEE